MYGIAVKSPEELVIFLKLHGVNGDEERAKEIWNGMKEPLLFNINKGKLKKHKKIFQIAHVWEKDNVRYALWNSKKIEISAPKDIRYNYLDKGYFELENVILRFNRMDSETLENIRLFFLKGSASPDDKNEFDYADPFLPRRHWRFGRRGFQDRISFTLEELKEEARCVKFGRRYFKRNPEKTQEELDKTKEILKKNAEWGMEITDEFIKHDGMKWGIDGKKLNQYLSCDPFPMELFHEKDFVLSSLVSTVFKAVFELAGERHVWVGNYPVKVTSTTRNRARKWSIEGFEIDRHDLEYSLWEARRYSDKEGYVVFLRKISRTPRIASELLERGLVITTGRYHGDIILVTIPVKRGGENWYFVSTVDGRKFRVNGGYAALKNLHSRLMFGTSGRVVGRDVFDDYLLLAEHIPKEELFRIFEQAGEDTKKLIERAKALLKETLQKFSDRVREGHAEIDDEDMKGYIVKGKIRNYFIDRENLGIYSYPEGRYVCIVDEEYKLIVIDRLVNRIYLLLNDEKLKRSVETLDDEEDFDNIELEIGGD